MNGSQIKEPEGTGPEMEPSPIDSKLEDEIATQEAMEQVQAQRAVYLNQVDALQRLVEKQIELTGANPLRKQMLQAASAAGETELDSETHATKEGDELASESMELSQEAEDLLLGQFSIKDTISPQDAHNLAERAGIDGAKVQRFFQTMRGRVRKYLLRLPNPVVTKRSKRSDEAAVVPEALSERDVQPLSCPAGGLVHDKVPAFVEVMKQARRIGERMMLLRVVRNTKEMPLLEELVQHGALKELTKWVIEAKDAQATLLLMGILTTLERLPISFAALSNSGSLGKAVNSLSRYKRLEVSRASGSLIRYWSTMLLDQDEAPRWRELVPSKGDDKSERADAAAARDGAGARSSLKPDYMRVREARRKQQFMERLLCGPATIEAAGEPAVVTARAVGGGKAAAERDSSAAVSRQRPRAAVLGFPVAVNSQKASTRRKFEAAGVSSQRQGRETTPPLEIPSESQHFSKRPRQSEPARPIPESTARSTNRHQDREQRQPHSSKAITNASMYRSTRAHTAASMDAHRRPLVPPTLARSAQQFHSWPWFVPPRMCSTAEVGMGEESEELQTQRIRDSRSSHVHYQLTMQIPPSPREPLERDQIVHEDYIVPLIPLEEGQPINAATESHPQHSHTHELPSSSNLEDVKLPPAVQVILDRCMETPDLLVKLIDQGAFNSFPQLLGPIKELVQQKSERHG